MALSTSSRHGLMSGSDKHASLLRSSISLKVYSLGPWSETPRAIDGQKWNTPVPATGGGAEGAG
jgi:hypothetical protein